MQKAQKSFLNFLFLTFSFLQCGSMHISGFGVRGTERNGIRHENSLFVRVIYMPTCVQYFFFFFSGVYPPVSPLGTLYIYISFTSLEENLDEDFCEFKISR